MINDYARYKLLLSSIHFGIVMTWLIDRQLSFIPSVIININDCLHQEVQLG